jgi:TPR repeat protein
MRRKSSISRYKLSKSDLALWLSTGLGLILLPLTLGWEDSQLFVYAFFVVLSVEAVLDLLNWLQRDEYLPSILLIWVLAALAMGSWLFIRHEYLLLVSLFGAIPWLAIAVMAAGRAYRSYLHWSAKRGKARDQYRLAELYYYGTGVKENLETAVHWYHQAAQKRYTRAERKLSRLYKYGDGVPKDQRLADEWYTRSRRSRE